MPISRLRRAVKGLQERFAQFALRLRYAKRPKGGPKAKLIKEQHYVRLVIHREKNHARPHFHIHFKQQYSASYAIDTFERLAGRLPRKYEEVMLEWARKHQKLLLNEWMGLRVGATTEEELIPEKRRPFR